MADDPPDDDVRTELVRVEQELENLQQTVRDLRAGLNDAGAVDPEDRSLVLSQAEEQQAIMAELEQRRDHLREQLGSS
jgi:small-conductance mechanosensitive channel